MGREAATPSGRSLSVALAPSLVLILLVVSTSGGSLFGTDVIPVLFGAFVVGSVLIPLALGVYATGLLSRATFGPLLVGGLSLVLSSVALYLVYGCVFGCLG